MRARPGLVGSYFYKTVTCLVESVSNIVRNARTCCSATRLDLVRARPGPARGYFYRSVTCCHLPGILPAILGAFNNGVLCFYINWLIVLYFRRWANAIFGKNVLCSIFSNETQKKKKNGSREKKTQKKLRVRFGRLPMATYKQEGLSATGH